MVGLDRDRPGLFPLLTSRLSGRLWPSRVGLGRGIRLGRAQRIRPFVGLVLFFIGRRIQVFDRNGSVFLNGNDGIGYFFGLSFFGSLGRRRPCRLVALVGLNNGYVPKLVPQFVDVSRVAFICHGREFLPFVSHD